jgi:hypothetical protein
VRSRLSARPALPASAVESLEVPSERATIRESGGIDLSSPAGMAKPSTDALVSLADVLNAYEARYARARDSRAIFTLAYARLTRRLASALPTADIGDKEWVTSLALAFGGYYIRALDGYDAGSLTIVSWAETRGERTRTLWPVTERITGAHHG